MAELSRAQVNWFQAQRKYATAGKENIRRDNMVNIRILSRTVMTRPTGSRMTVHYYLSNVFFNFFSLSFLLFLLLLTLFLYSITNGK